MQAMEWWSVPLVAFVLAIVWVSVANRPRRRADPHDSVAEHQRFRQAMARQVGTAAKTDHDPRPGGEPGPDQADAPDPRA